MRSFNRHQQTWGTFFANMPHGFLPLFRVDKDLGLRPGNAENERNEMTADFAASTASVKGSTTSSSVTAIQNLAATR